MQANKRMPSKSIMPTATAQTWIYFALQEADAVSDTFKRWFDASNAQDVKNVFLKMFDPSGVGQPTTLMTRWICERDDIKGACRPTSNAYSVYNKGQFHFCPLGLTKPAADSLKCADLDGFASMKMKSVAFTMVHESTHWDQVGDAALGKHIGDVKVNGVTANGAFDCFNLSPSDKLVNAQNYAFLASEAYFKKKGYDDDLSISPATYSGGWCGIHVTQYQKNEPGDGPQDNNPEYQLSVCVFDGNGVLLNQYPGAPQGTCGVFVALNGQPQPIDTALPNILYVTAGAVDSDAVLFNYGEQNWGSNDQEHHSKFGAYDSGSRQGDTGFSC
ncbi:hypothetical protein MMC22_004353 [Lobaria immixta]|nr:hypothetical protein [Lobaria immixta]